MKCIKIGWLFPDTLYLHGDNGNILALKRFCKLGGLDAKVERINFGNTSFTPDQYDILVCPPGEIASFNAVIKELIPHKDALISFINSGKPLIVTGTSVAMWCNKITRLDGSVIEGLGIINAEARERNAVYGDDVYFNCNYNDTPLSVIGSQIQMLDFENIHDEYFGDLVYGYGLSNDSLHEGFKKKNSFFTNTLGPLLALNPRLTVEILKTVYPDYSTDYDFKIEDSSFESKKKFICAKTPGIIKTKSAE